MHLADQKFELWQASVLRGTVLSPFTGLAIDEVLFKTRGRIFGRSHGGHDPPNGSLNVGGSCPIFRCLYHINIDKSKYR